MRRTAKSWWKAIAALLIGVNSAAHAATLTDSALTATFGADGIESIVLARGSPCTTHPTPNTPPQGYDAPTPLTSSAVDASPDQITISRTYNLISERETWTLEGNDLLASVTITNGSATPLPAPIELQLPSFSLGPGVDGNLPDWNAAYIVAGNYHPSVWVPLAAQWFHDRNYGVCFYSKSNLASGTVFSADANPYGGGTPLTKLTRADVVFYLNQSVPPGGTISFTITLRIVPTPASGVSLPSLLARYIADYQAAYPIQYSGIDERPQISFSDIGARPTLNNPYGYNFPWYRLDLLGGPDGGQNRFEALIAPLSGLAAGVVHWQPQGLNPRGVAYRPDFTDHWPGPTRQPDGQISNAARNLPILFRWEIAHRLTPGLCARLDCYVNPPTGPKDTTSPLLVDNAAEMAKTIARFRAAQKLGMRSYYLDSFGTDTNSAEIMQKVRAAIGPHVATWSEYTSDVMLACSGLYAEPTNPPDPDGATKWYTAEEMQVFRLLQPTSNVLLNKLDVNGRPAYGVQQLGTWKYTPLVPAARARFYILYFRALESDYMNPTTHEWK
jgi:hypothetical protein